MASPYDGKDVAEWSAITKGLIARHPLKKAEIVETVLKAWDLESIREGGCFLP